MKGQREKLTELLEQTAELLTHFSVPLYVDDRKGHPFQVGTGFFINYDDESYLATAEHVFSENREKLYWYIESKAQRMVDGSVGFNVPADVAVVRLDKKYRPPYPAVSKAAMPLDYLAPQLLPRTGRDYCMVGFPHSKNQFSRVELSAVAAPFVYRSESIADAAYAEHELDPAYHIAIPLDPRKCSDIDGNPIVFPHPRGMSGSPIAVIYSEHDAPFRTFPIVGIGVRFLKRERLLIAADIAFVLGAIEFITNTYPRRE